MKKNNKRSLTTKLIVVLGVLVIAVLGLMLYGSINKQSVFNIFPEKLKNTNPTKVATLDSREENIGTVIYSAAKVIGDIKNINDKYITELELTDSVDGVTNIYAQDLLNRYPDLSVTKQVNSFSDATDNKSTILKCKGKSGSITITVWSKKNGKTAVKIEKDASF